MPSDGNNSGDGAAEKAGSRSPRKSRSRSRSPAPARNRSPSPKPVADNDGRNLYVGGVSMRTRDAALEELFAKHGKVQSCELAYDPRSREHRGFGFVVMETSAGAQAAVDALHNSSLDNRVLTVQFAKRSRKRTPTPGAFLGRERHANYGRGRDDDRRGGSRYDDRDRRDRRSRSRSPRRRRSRSRSPRRRSPRRSRSRSPRRH